MSMHARCLHILSQSFIQACDFLKIWLPERTFNGRSDHPDPDGPGNELETGRGRPDRHDLMHIFLCRPVTSSWGASR